MNTSLVIQSQLLATKFYVPVAPGTLIVRPRLSALLAESLRHPLTLVSAPAGFGKTMLLSGWTQSLSANNLVVAWLSLDEEDNDPQLFWTYVLSALDQQQPERFTPLLKSLQSAQAPPLTYILTALCNLVLESQEHMVLILDDYHVITEQEVHSTLSYLIEHLVSQLHIILSTRVDPPLPLSLLRARQQMVEVRTEQLRCTAEETGAFLHQIMGLHLSEATIQEVTARTEGWLVGLQLLGLSFPERVNPTTLLQEISGDQRYILDYLTDEVLGRQSQEVQTFLLSTCILQRLSASLCDGVMQQTGSQHLLQQIEQANLFVVALDSKRQWYRYHALFAQALHCQLEQRQPDLIPILHHRASLWYAQHEQTTEAILHALQAREWQWAADLIEHRSLQVMNYTWKASTHQVIMLQHFLEQLPIAIIASRPRLCITCVWMLWAIAPLPLLNGWLDAAEADLTALLSAQTSAESSPMILSPQARQEQEDLLGQVLVWRATLHCGWEDHGPSVLALCQQASSLLSSQNCIARAYIGMAEAMAYYTSANDTMVAAECGLKGIRYAQAAGEPILTILIVGLTAVCLIDAGQLHEVQRLIEQFGPRDHTSAESMVPEMGWPLTWQAEILREWNQLDAARTLIGKVISLTEQVESVVASPYLFYAYAVLLRILISRGDLEEARSTLQHIEYLIRNAHWNQTFSLFFRSEVVLIDPVRLWLACGDLDRATHCDQQLEMEAQHGTPLVREREAVACVRILLARTQPHLALQRLEPVLEGATGSKRWRHVIEIRLLQALAYQMHQQETQALNALSEAVRLAEPEGYIRSFVDEGTSMKALLSRLREEHSKDGLTSYLDTVLAAFPRQTKAQKRQPKRTRQERLP